MNVAIALLIASIASHSLEIDALTKLEKALTLISYNSSKSSIYLSGQVRKSSIALSYNS
jgi:hypothetical protein